MTPFKPDNKKNHAVNQIPNHEGEQAVENVDTLMDHITNENRYGDLQVAATDTTLVGFDPIAVARQRMNSR